MALSKKMLKLTTSLSQLRLFENLYERPIDSNYLSQIHTDVIDSDKSLIVTGKLFENSHDQKTFRDFIFNTITRNISVIKSSDIKIWTAKSFVMDYKSLKSLTDLYQGKHKNYIKDQYKCGHFSVDFVDYASDITLGTSMGGNLAVGILAFYWKDRNSIGYGHALNWAVTYDDGILTMWIIEPQTGECVKINNYFSNMSDRGNRDFRLALFLML